MFNNTKKNILAFEFGVVLSDVAKKRKVKMTRELVERAEKIIENEFKKKTANQIAGSMEVLVLSVFEVN